MHLLVSSMVFPILSTSSASTASMSALTGNSFSLSSLGWENLKQFYQLIRQYLKKPNGTQDHPTPLIGKCHEKYPLFFYPFTKEYFEIIWNMVHHLMRQIFANSVQLCIPDLTSCHIIDIFKRNQPYLSQHIYCRISESHTFPLALLRHGYLTTNTMFSLLHMIKDFFVLWGLKHSKLRWRVSSAYFLCHKMV